MTTVATVDELVSGLTHRSGKTRQKAVKELAQRAMKEEDIAPAVHLLQGAFADRTLYVAAYATTALVHHFVQKGEWGAVQKLVKHRRSPVRLTAIGALGSVALSGRDISPLLPMLERILENSLPGLGRYGLTKSIVNVGCHALVLAVIQRNDREALLRWANHADPNVRLRTAISVDMTVVNRKISAPLFWVVLPFFLSDSSSLVREKGEQMGAAFPPLSVEALDHAQHTLETFLADWSSRQPPDRVERKIGVRNAVAGLLRTVSGTRNFLVACNDGELLAGETIAGPKRGNRMYQAVRMPNR